MHVWTNQAIFSASTEASTDVKSVRKRLRGTEEEEKLSYESEMEVCAQVWDGQGKKIII